MGMPSAASVGAGIAPRSRTNEGVEGEADADPRQVAERLPDQQQPRRQSGLHAGGTSAVTVISLAATGTASGPSACGPAGAPTRTKTIGQRDREALQPFGGR
jgi:hypothetical protein